MALSSRFTLRLTAQFKQIALFVLSLAAVAMPSQAAAFGAGGPSGMPHLSVTFWIGGGLIVAIALSLHFQNYLQTRKAVSSCPEALFEFVCLTRSKQLSLLTWIAWLSLLWAERLIPFQNQADLALLVDNPTAIFNRVLLAGLIPLALEWIGLLQVERLYRAYSPNPYDRQDLWVRSILFKLFMVLLVGWLFYLLSVALESTFLQRFDGNGQTFVAVSLVLALVGKLLKQPGEVKFTEIDSGEMVVRSRQLAQQLGVNVNHFFVVAHNRVSVVNAFATSKPAIVFGRELFSAFTQAEFDTVIAHELTHLQLRHPQRITNTWMTCWGVGCGAIWLLAPAIDPLPWIGRCLLPGVILIGSAVRYYGYLRQCELDADAGGVSLTGHPQAAISMLAKVAQLNRAPQRWPVWLGVFLGYPTYQARMRAIARQANIPTNELNYLMSVGVRGCVDNSYSLPLSKKDDSQKN